MGDAIELRSISERLADTELVTAALARANRAARRLHKRMGVPMAVGKDGKVAWIQPEDIPDEDAE